MSQIRILYAEDELWVKEMMSMFIPAALPEHSTSIDYCVDGAEFLSKANPAKYDLYITDQNMPRLTGIAALQEIRTRGDKTPALLMSGGGNNVSAYKSLEKVAFATKPMIMHELTNTLLALLEIGKK